MIPAKILEQIERAAEKRSKSQNTTANEHLDKAVSWYLKIGFEDGAQFGFQLAQEIYAPLVEAVKKTKHQELCMFDIDLNEPCDCNKEHLAKALSALAEKLGEP